MGSGIDNSQGTFVYNGELIASGNFTEAGGVPANGIASWDGTSWAPLGSGLGGGDGANGMIVEDGDLIVGGEFNTAGGMEADKLARWGVVCPCFAVVSEEITCHPDGTTFTLNVEGMSACTGDTVMATFTDSGGAVG